ncbi:hypothetical protein D9M69_586610 [compost metagenome]
MVGVSGMAGERCGEVTASARSVPAFTCGSTPGIVVNMKSIWPPIRSVIAGPPPLYGTCVNCSLAALLNISPARWPGVPAPAEPMLVRSPCDRMYAISS